MIRIEIATDNAAFYDMDDTFDPGPEIRDILDNLLSSSTDWARYGGTIKLRDSNGNVVGKATADAGL